MCPLSIAPGQERRWRGLSLLPFLVAALGAQEVSIEEALDVEGTGFVFRVDKDSQGDPAWFGQTVFSNDGMDAVEVRTNGLSIAHDLSTTVEGPVKVRFFADYKTDPDPGDAWFECLVDDESRFQVQGRTFGVYEEFVVAVGPGPHELTWRYVKKISFVSGQYVRVDQMELLPPGEGPPAFYLQPEPLQDLPAGEPLTLAVGAIDADSFQWFKDGEEIPGEDGPEFAIPVLAAGDSGVYHVVATNLAGSAASVAVDLKVWTAAETPAVLDYTGPGAITLQGDGLWGPTRLSSDAGGSSMASPPLGPGESADLCLEVTGPARIDFDWRTDCERWDDVLELLVDGVPVDERSGSTSSSSFVSRSVTVTPGDHLLCWRYRKDGANSHYSDQVWLDNIRLVEPATGAAPPVIESQPVNLELEPGNTAVLSLGLPADLAWPATVDWYRIGSLDPVGSGATLTIPGADPVLHGGEYFASVTNANGSIDSDPVTLSVRWGFLSNLVEVQLPPTSQRLRTVVAVPKGPLLAFGDGVMLSSHDNGASFEATNPFFGRQILGAAVAGTGEVAVVGPSGFVASTTDAGATWKEAAVPTRETLRDVAWVPSSDASHPGGFFCAVGSRGTVLGRALDGDPAWFKIHLPGEVPRDGIRCDAVGESCVFVTSQGNFMGVCDPLNRTCGDLIPLEQLDGSLRGVCGDERGGPPSCWVIDSTGGLFHCDLDGSGPPPIQLSGAGSAIDCNGSELLIAVPGAIQVGTGAGAQTIALPEGVLLDDVAPGSGGGIVGCGSGGATVLCTAAGTCELTSSDRAPAIAGAPRVTVSEDGIVIWNGQLLGPFDPRPENVVMSGDEAILPVADLAAAPYTITAAGDLQRSDWDRSAALNLAETVVARTWVRNPNSTGSALQAIVDVMVTSDGRVLCAFGSNPPEDVTASLPGSAKIIGTGKLSREIPEEAAVVIAEDGESFYLTIDQNGVKAWLPFTVSVSDLSPGERVVEVAIAPSEHVLARTNFGTLIQSGPGGDWSRRVDIGGSGSVRIAFKEGEGFLVFMGSRLVYVIEEDFSSFRKMVTSTPFPAQTFGGAGGDSFGLITFPGGVLVPPSVEPRVTINGATVLPGMEGNKGVDFREHVPIAVRFDEPVGSVRISIDGQPAVDGAPAGADHREFSLSWDAPAGGAHRISIEAFDESGGLVSSFESELWVFLPLEFDAINPGRFSISWDGGETLQRYDEPAGIWRDAPGASSPVEMSVAPSLEGELFRLRAP